MTTLTETASLHNSSNVQQATVENVTSTTKTFIRASETVKNSSIAGLNKKVNNLENKDMSGIQATQINNLSKAMDGMKSI